MGARATASRWLPGRWGLHLRDRGTARRGAGKVGRGDPHCNGGSTVRGWGQLRRRRSDDGDSCGSRWRWWVGPVAPADDAHRGREISEGGSKMWWRRWPSGGRCQARSRGSSEGAARGSLAGEKGAPGRKIGLSGARHFLKGPAARSSEGGGPHTCHVVGGEGGTSPIATARGHAHGQRGRARIGEVGGCQVGPLLLSGQHGQRETTTDGWALATVPGFKSQFGQKRWSSFKFEF
jgi:hypothetical protein